MAIKKITMQRLDATVIANMGGGGTGGGLAQVAKRLVRQIVQHA